MRRSPFIRRYHEALVSFDQKECERIIVKGLDVLSEVKNADFYFFKGEEHRMRGENRIAIFFYRKALVTEPEHGDSLFWMGYCYLPDENEKEDLGLKKKIRYEMAARAFKKIIARGKKEDEWCLPEVYYNLGLAQSNLGLHEVARESFTLSERERIMIRIMWRKRVRIQEELKLMKRLKALREKLKNQKD